MSLLMDALRRAEEEKKRQEAQEGKETARPAGAEKAPEPGVDTGAVTVQSAAAGPEDVTMQIEAASLEEESAALEQPPAQLEMEPLDPFEDGDTSASMTVAAGPELEPLDPFEDGDTSDSMMQSDGLELTPLEVDDDIGQDDTRSDTLETGADSTGATTRGGARARSDQTSTLPSTRAVQHDLEAYFEQSQSMELPRGDSRSAGDSTLEDVAAHTVVGAQTVFAAGERPRSRPILLIGASLALLIVIGIGIIGFFYAQQTPEQRTMPSPAVADGVERQDPRELPVVPIQPRTTSAAAALPRIDTRPPLTISETEPLPLVEGRQDLAPQTSEAALAMKAPVEIATVESDEPLPEVEPAPIAEAPLPTGTPSVPAPPPISTEPVIDVGVGEVRISRTRKPAAVDADIQGAYDAFSNGDMATAKSRYETALAGHPDRRDALLGLGAIAQGEGDLATAYRHYAAVLKRVPDDPVATAALLSLTGGRGEATAARLRMLLDSHGDSAFIHFALGNWYARQGRWGNAQQAYFSAVGLDAENADYNFNLAVSLDRLGQGPAALNYYQKSLSLADASGGNFNPANVLQRISNLSSTLAP